MQPGETINPTPPESDINTVNHQQPEPVVPEQLPTATSPQPNESRLPQQEETAVASRSAPASDKTTISWDASEYIEHQKPTGWYLALVVASVVVTAGIYLATKGDLVVTFAIAMAAILFGVTAARKPRTLHYVIDNHGISIGGKVYSYGEFKVFSLIDDTAIRSVQLLPLKRFMPPISLHFPPDQENDIVETLGRYLPYQQANRDTVDRVMGRLRF